MGQTTVTIGSGTNATDLLPTNVAKKYSYTQQIYNSSNFPDGSGKISSISFYVKTNSAARDLDIYMVNTSKSSFSNNADWISVSDSDKVYSNEVTFTQGGWTTITLPNSFSYTGNNLAIIINDKTGTATDALQFYRTNGNSIYVSNDDSSYDPSSPGSGTKGYIINQIKIQITYDYPRPSNLSVTDITTNTATVSWTAPTPSAGNTLTGYQYAIKSSSSYPYTPTATTNPINLSELEAGTDYSVRIRAVYTDSNSTTHYSNYIETSFTTDCNPISDLAEAEWDFENSSSLPDCWRITGSQTISSQTYPSVVKNTNYSHNGSSYCLQFKGNYNEVVLLPAIEGGLNDNRIEFYAKGSSQYHQTYNIVIGYYDTNNDFIRITNNFTINSEYPAEAFHADFSGLPSYVNKVAIKGNTGGDSYLLFLDDVSILTPNACTPVSSPTVGTVTYNSAQLSWTAGDETNWKLQYRVSGEEDWTTVNVSSANLSAGVYTLSGLSENTTYEWQVAAWCDTSDDDDISTYVPGEDFSTPAQYPMPTGLAADNITANSADITWTAGSSETAWQLYYTPYDYATPGNASPGDYINISTTPAYSMTGLTGNTTYYVYVRANYGEDHYSSWTDAMSFRTSVSLPYSYDFEDGSEMNYWTISNGNSTTGRNNSNGYNSSEYSFRFMYGSSYTTQYLISPELNNTTLGVHVEFFAYRSSNSNSGQSTLNVSYSTEGNNTFSWDDDDAFIPTYNSYILYKFDFPAGTKYIAIKYAASTYDYIYIDNISFRNSDNKFTTTGNWSTAANWSYGTLPTASDDVIINAACTIPNACIAEANNITLGPSGSLTIEDGGQLICNNAVNATVHKTIAAWNEGSTGGWYFIASPINVNNLAPTNVTNMISDENAANGDRTYDLYSLENITWHNYRANSFNLANGRGYLYASEEGADLQFSGTIKAYDANHTISVSEGWNLIGNPYTFEAYPNQAYYTINDANSGITAQTSASSAVVAPCTGIIVKAAENGTVKFLNEAPASSANNGNLQMVLAHKVATRDGASVNKTIDNAIVSFNEGGQLEKFHFGNPAASIFIPQNGEDYAIAFSDRQGDVPLNFKANETGTYTISFAGDEMDLNGIHLIDILAEEEIDLSVNQSYTFIGSPADRAERFVIRFENSEQPDKSVFAYQSGNDIIVSGEGELQIFDVMGRMVSRQYVSGVETINAMPYGVYIFKLNGMTQKIVVR